MDAWRHHSGTELRGLLPILSYKLHVEDPLECPNWLDGSYHAYGLQLQFDVREAAQWTELSEQVIENEIVECFVLSPMDPRAQHAMYDRWYAAKSSLEQIFGVMDNYCTKGLRAIVG